METSKEAVDVTVTFTASFSGKSLALEEEYNLEIITKQIKSFKTTLYSNEFEPIMIEHQKRQIALSLFKGIFGIILFFLTFLMVSILFIFLLGNYGFIIPMVWAAIVQVTILTLFNAWRRNRVLKALS